MDILYILGNGSVHDNMEIRLSLRTVEKYAKNLDRVFIVGDCPSWIQNVVHIPQEDRYYFAQNHYLKVYTACKSDISDNFLLMNDDFYMTKPFNVERYPYYVRGPLVRNKQANHLYKKVINKTYDYLVNIGCNNPLNYSVHSPIIYNKQNIIDMKEIAESVLHKTVGYSIRNLYGNFFVKHGIEVHDPKMHEDSEELIQTQTGCVSSSDKCDKLLKTLDKMFHVKSKYEK